MRETVALATATTNLGQYRDLLRNLVAKEIKVRFMGTVLGFAWSLVSSLVTVLVYLVVFTYIFRSPQPNHPLFLINGIIHWIFFSQLIGQSSEMLVSNAGLIKKVYFPRILISVSNILVALILWISVLATFLLLFPLLGGRYSLELLVYPFYLVLFATFCWGLSLVLATFYVGFRDLKHLVEVALRVLFFATPIIYPLSMVPGVLRRVLVASPLTDFILIFQSIFYANSLPSLKLTLAAIAWTIVSAGFGLWVFNRRMPGLVERL